MALGLIFAMHTELPPKPPAARCSSASGRCRCPGLLIILYVMYGWWADVVKEAHRGDHTRVVQLHLRYGMIMFIASEVMFFVAWFWAFFDASLYAGEVQQIARVEATGGQWPPASISILDPWHLPLLNTLILLTSAPR
jgi:cytochrome c oxidase subunit 3